MSMTDSIYVCKFGNKLYYKSCKNPYKTFLLPTNSCLTPTQKSLYSIFKELFLDEVIILQIDFVCQEVFLLFSRFLKESLSTSLTRKIILDFHPLVKKFFILFLKFLVSRIISTHVFHRVKVTSIGRRRGGRIRTHGQLRH